MDKRKEQVSKMFVEFFRLRMPKQFVGEPFSVSLIVSIVKIHA